VAARSGTLGITTSALNERIKFSERWQRASRVDGLHTLLIS
jgi:hypothetical protein